MFHAAKSHPATAAFGAALLALAAALLAGCRGNTSAAAPPEHQSRTPPTILAVRTHEDLTDSDPFTNAQWRSAHWESFTAPTNSSSTAPPTRAAVLYDSKNVYFAVISQETPAPTLVERDAVSMYVDPKSHGRELLQVTTDSAGTSHATWIRTAAAPEPQEDGAPNTSFPLDIRPDYPCPGLTSKVRQGTTDGRTAWALTLTLPVTSLPPVMQAPLSGDWQFNILRNVSSGQADHRRQVQSNLSPVYMNAQAFSPYRLATLKFATEE